MLILTQNQTHTKLKHFNSAQSHLNW